MQTRWPLIALALLLITPLVAAQVPASPVQCGPLSATVAVPTEVGVGERGDVTLSVRNHGNFSATVTVAAALQSSPGWRLLDGADQTGSIAAGATSPFTFRVEPEASATGPATVTFAISGTCSPPGGFACPQNACDAQAVNAQGQVPLRQAEGLRIPGLDSVNFPLEYLVAGLVLVGITTAVPFLLRKKKARVLAQCPEPLKLVRPGRGSSFPIELRNPGPEPLTARLEVGPVPEGWSAFMPLPEVQLAPREARSLWLMVRAPQEAAQGQTVDVELRLTTPQQGTSTLRVRAEVNEQAAER